MDTKKLRFQKTDILAILAVLLVMAAVFVWFRPDLETFAGSAEIYLDGELLKVVSLAEDQTFTVGEKYTNTITVRSGKIAVTASDCPGEDCVHSGTISKAGKALVCLPNAVEIRIVGASEIDFVVG